MSLATTQLAALQSLIGRTIVSIERAESGFEDTGLAIDVIVLDDGSRIELTGGDDNQAYIDSVVKADGTDVPMHVHD